MDKAQRNQTSLSQSTSVLGKLGDAIQTADQIKRPVVTSKRLQAVLGLGDQPKVTLALYAKLERGTFEHGYEFEKIVKTCLKASRSANHPCRYFAASVTRRLRESGF